MRATHLETSIVAKFHNLQTFPCVSLDCHLSPIMWHRQSRYELHSTLMKLRIWERKWLQLTLLSCQSSEHRQILALLPIPPVSLPNYEGQGSRPSHCLLDYEGAHQTSSDLNERSTDPGLKVRCSNCITHLATRAKWLLCPALQMWSNWENLSEE